MEPTHKQSPGPENRKGKQESGSHCNSPSCEPTEPCCSVETSNTSESAPSWETEKTELVDTLKRLAADFDNYKKRVARDAQEQSSQAGADIISDLLPVLDNFELCLQVEKNLPENARKGLEMIYANLLTTLERRGVSIIDAIGKPFDPRMHEALLSGEGAAKNTVLEVLQKGYALNGKVLRTAKVKIAQ